MMRASFTALSVALAVAVAGCTSVREVQQSLQGTPEPVQTTGGGLSVPPGYGARPEAVDNEQRREGRAVIERERPRSGPDGGPERIGELSATESAVLRGAGIEDQNDPVVRRTLAIESQRTVSRERQFVEKLLRWDPERAADVEASGAGEARSVRPLIRRVGGS